MGTSGVCCTASAAAMPRCAEQTIGEGNRIPSTTLARPGALSTDKSDGSAAAGVAEPEHSPIALLPAAQPFPRLPELHTPTLDRLQREGLTFERFFCASPVCSPARASLTTGRLPSAHGVHDWIRPEALARAGSPTPPFTPDFLERAGGADSI